MSQLHPGDALGGSYKLVERIGSGAAGDVWLAEPTAGGPVVAAKILKSEHANDPDLVERFVRERSVLLGLRHHSIVDVRDLVVEGSTLAFVMEYLPGGSLRDLLNQSGPLPASDALTLSAQVLQALAVSHAQRVTHRDIKPDNVLLAEAWQTGQQNTARVTDFGIASVVNERNRQTTGLLGTPQYMAPELISHGQTTAAADVYSTGVMLYELLAGRTPFAGPGTDFTIAYRHVTSRPPQLDVPIPLWEALDRLLAKDPRERPTAADAAAILSGLSTQFVNLPPLEAQTASTSFEEIDRPATMLRSDLLTADPDIGEYMSPLGESVPELGDDGGHTMLRPMPKRAPLVIPQRLDPEENQSRFPSWLTKKTVILGSVGVLLLAGLGIGMAVMFGDKPAEANVASDESLQATQQDPALPTGLGISRAATFDPETNKVTLEVTYAAQKAPLAGSYFQAIPAIDDGSACPAVTWEGAQATKHQASTTGIKAECGWRLDNIETPENGQTTVTAEFPGSVADAESLNEWLATAASSTAEAMNDPESISTEYTAQRLQNITVSVPPRTVSQTPLQITLLPVWPSGVDELNPLFRSPATGAPSQMLQDIAGGTDNVRFSDGCSGAVAVSADGLTATALNVTSDCRLRAVVGNFTNLESSPFSVTTRE